MLLKDYSFPAIFYYETDGSGISLSFPDLKEAYTCADNEIELTKNAREVLELVLEQRIEDKKEIPFPTSIKDIKLKKGEYIIMISAIVENEVKYIKKTLTIPEHINKKALVKGINFSQTLTEALEEKLKD